MKSLVVIFVIFAISSVSADDQEKEEVFNEYLRNTKVRFGRGANVEKAKENVYRKWKEIKEQNEKFDKGESLFRSELNELSWQDLDQIRREKLGFILPEQSVNNSHLPPLPGRSKREALPTYFNWADKGVVRSPENQGSCGSCYTFAAIGAIESRACITKNQCIFLSKQEAMECTNGCKGGWDDWVYKYINEKGGAAAASYSYTPYLRSSCATASTRPRAAYTKSYNWWFLQGYPETTIREYLKAMGPMFVSYRVYENFYQYRSGIYSNAGGSYLGGHAVLLVGWGEENGRPYWIMRNSWGPSWGENGFFRMYRGINLCDVETQRLSVPLTV